MLDDRHGSAFLRWSDDSDDVVRVLALQDFGDARRVSDDVAARKAGKRPHHDQMHVHEVSGLGLGGEGLQ
ncbi:MAG: hypothetical protein ACRDTS_16275, partial [Mycobacterium sp.]